MEIIKRSEEERADHLTFLREKVFQTQTKWPHFEGLFSDVLELSKLAKEEDNIICLERAYIYGGGSLFSPLFGKGRVQVVDCQTSTAKERGAYQRSWMDDTRYIFEEAEIRNPIENTGLDSECADLVIVPNVVHHVKNQEAMFAEISRILKPGGRGYIFEALLRELHQMPDDYIRYTPWGFETELEKQDLVLDRWTPAGSPFEAIRYCWIQALEYLPEALRKEKEDWLYGTHIPDLEKMESEYPDNLSRKHTSFPLAYGIHFSKPEKKG